MLCVCAFSVSWAVFRVFALRSPAASRGHSHERLAHSGRLSRISQSIVNTSLSISVPEKNTDLIRDTQNTQNIVFYLKIRTCNKPQGEGEAEASRAENPNTTAHKNALATPRIAQYVSNQNPVRNDDED